MTVSKKIYFDDAKKSIPRLLSQLDRQPFSASAGSWHRPYWHQRFSDFSSSACQQGVLALALLYRLDVPENTLFGKPVVREWIESSIEYLLSLQHRDGSFDEWYPNERGWAGPTGYVIYALVKSWDLVGRELSPELGERVRTSALRACRFLGKYEEKDVLANHQAMALLAIAATQAAFPDVSIASVYDELLSRLEKSTCSEGWSLEYDGADPGYQTATLSFLARVHASNGDERIVKLIEPMLEFVSHFFFNGTSFAGLIGSRGTRNVFHLGFEYWAHRFPIAETLAAHTRKMLAAGTLLSAADQEDHYLIYRLPEFLETFGAAKDIVEKKGNLPFERAPFQRHFENAGLVCIKTESNYFVANIKKGGAFKLVRPDGRLVEDSGWVLRRGGLLTSSYCRDDHESSVRANEIRVSGIASPLRQPLFTPSSFVAFRLGAKAIGFSAGSARGLKSFVRSMIITGRSKETSARFTRSLRLSDDGCEVVDRIEIASRAHEIDKVWVGGSFQTRTVPQSRYFESSELENSPVEIAPIDLEELRNHGRIEISRKFN